VREHKGVIGGALLSVAGLAFVSAPVTVATAEHQHFSSSIILGLLAGGVACTIAGLGVLGASRPSLRRRLRVIGVGIDEFRRTANASRQPDDLQVLYARLRVSHRGGGRKRTMQDAEAWMEAFDESGNRVAQSKGNWFSLDAGRPVGWPPAKSMTLRPTGEEYALELAGKFDWGDSAWLAGEGDPPSLAPGAYRIRATVSDGTKAFDLEWLVSNPGRAGLLSTKAHTQRKGQKPTVMTKDARPMPAMPLAPAAPSEAKAEEIVKHEPTALQTKGRQRRAADLIVTRVDLARDLRVAFDEFIETFLTRRAEYVAHGMKTERLEQAREEYQLLQRRAVRAYRAVRDDYRRFLDDEPQFDRGSPDPDYYVAQDWLADWWSPLTFDAALNKYANADDDHLRPHIAEDRAILEAFVEWVAEPAHHDLSGDIAGVNLEDAEIGTLVQRQLAEREQQTSRQKATLSARPGATSGREHADEYNFGVMNSGPATAFRVRAWAARADGTSATAPVEMYTLPADNRWNQLRLEIPRQSSDAGGLRLVVSWGDESGPHEEELLEILPLR
jgi:hypothetical protein